MKARALGALVACGAVAAAARSAFVPAGVLALVSAALVVTQGGIDNPKPDPGTMSPP